MKLLKKISLTFFILLISYCSLLILSFSIPQQFIQTNAEKSIAMIEKEGLYPSINEGNTGSKRDNFTDRLMIRKTKKSLELSTIENTMSMDNYPRYWHGYQVFLRPLLVFMSLGSIRMIYAVILFLLIGLTSYYLIKRSDIYAGIAFLITLAVGNAATFFFSMQYANLWIFTLFITLLMLIKPRLVEKSSSMFLFFFIIGSLTNFLDLLTTPLISWGIPVILFFYLHNKYPTIKRENTQKQFGRLLFSGIFWGIGYGLTWFSKWLIASIVLKQNVIKDAITQILFRTEGNEDYPLQRLDMLRKNISLMYPKVTLLILGATCLIFLIIAIRKRTKIRSYTDFILFGVIALTPYIWFNILANHSQIHYWFTYREQMITTFALLCAFAFLIPPDLREDPYNKQMHGKSDS